MSKAVALHAVPDRCAASGQRPESSMGPRAPHKAFRRTPSRRGAARPESLQRGNASGGRTG
ncbi:MAG TPA: hypothetical protein VFM12_04305, partial [Gemmatimonadales bacterium]|nr:hypothetical protein [Gemmatimonadales bacterium]